MTLKSTLNVASAALLASGILSSYFAYSAKRWIDHTESKIAMVEVAAQDSSRRLQKVESESNIKWVDMERRLGSIETKLDRIIERK